MYKGCSKAQSLGEYTLLIMIVVMAIVGMRTYVKRGLNAKYKASVDAATTAVSEMDNNSDIAQYEPYYKEEKVNFSVKQVKEEEFTQAPGRQLRNNDYSVQEATVVSEEGINFTGDDLWEK